MHNITSETDASTVTSPTAQFYHLANAGEFMSWFSAGLAIAFITQMIPGSLIIYPVFLTTLFCYFGTAFHSNPQAYTLRITAIALSLVGYWNVVWLFRDVAISGALVLVVALIIGGLVICLRR